MNNPFVNSSNFDYSYRSCWNSESTAALAVVGLSYEANPTELVYSIEACGSTAFINALPVREGTIDELDVDHLRRVADALPPKQVLTYIVLAKLRPFTAEEIALANTCTILAEQFS